jgi:hypothetical protein
MTKNEYIQKKGRLYWKSFLTIEAIIIYVTGILLLGRPINRYMPNWFFGPWGFVLVLGFDMFWILCIKLWCPKNERLKILKKIMSVAVFALSASILTSWLILTLFQNVW